MKLPAEQYYETSLERMAQARLLHKQGTAYSLAIYVGGVAVECLLRAFKARHTAEFDERHDLLKLFSASRMLQVDPTFIRIAFVAVPLLSFIALSQALLAYFICGLVGAFASGRRPWGSDYERMGETKRTSIHQVRTTLD